MSEQKKCEHQWRAVPTPHPSVTGQLFTCEKCKAVEPGKK